MRRAAGLLHVTEYLTLGVDALSRGEETLVVNRIIDMRDQVIRQCPDGYPSCRKAEATGEWCRGECEAGKRT